MMRFARFEALVGLQAAEAIAQKTVLVAGIGGVGSYVCEALARSGVGTLVIVDPDVVDISNLNRQLWALDSTIGRLKVTVAQERLNDINPALRVIAFPVFLEASNIEAIFDRRIDFVCDAIDSLDSKVLLIRQARKKGIPVVSSMGFAKKLHPERIKIGLLKDTSVCPLAKTMRTKVKASGMDLSVPVVWSDEVPVVGSREDGLPSCATVPSVAGLLMASYVLNTFLEAGKEENA